VSAVLVRSYSTTETLGANSVSAVGAPNPFPIPFKPANIETGGLHFSLYNNIWGTKYVCVNVWWWWCVYLTLWWVVTTATSCGTHMFKRTRTSSTDSS
jgi:hypothetical protein